MPKLTLGNLNSKKLISQAGTSVYFDSNNLYTKNLVAAIKLTKFSQYVMVAVQKNNKRIQYLKK